MADDEPPRDEEVPADDTQQRRAHRRQYDEMATLRVESMRALARRDAALALLEENGSVTTEDVDRRVEATFNEPDPVTMANLLAQKAAAAVEHTRQQLDEERAGLERTEAKRAELQGHLEANEREIDEARERVSTRERELEQARLFARFAGHRGDATAAPIGAGVNVDAQTAESQAQGG